MFERRRGPWSWSSFAPVALGILAASCGATPSTSGPASRVARPKDDGGAATNAQFVQNACPQGGAPVAGGCLDLAGTRWQLTTHMPEGPRSFFVDFHPGGRLTSHDPADRSFENDQWAQEGTLVRFWFNDRYVQHTATLRLPDRMEGTAVNVQQTAWAWSAVRVYVQQLTPPIPQGMQPIDPRFH